jgi:cell division protein FtsI/penicillin-binding protein 2
VDKRRGAIGAAVAIAVVALVGSIAWFGPWRNHDDGAHRRPGMAEDDPAADAADLFALSWVTGKLAKVPATAESGDVAQRTLAITAGLGDPAGTTPSGVQVTRLDDAPVTTTTTAAGGVAAPPPARRKVATVTVSWKLDPQRTWTYETRVPFVETHVPAAAGSGGGGDGGDDAGEGKVVWKLDWTPSVVHPALRTGETLAAVRVTPTRGEVLGLDGQPLVGLRPVVEVGFQRSRATDPEGSARQVAGLVDVDADALVAKVKAAGPDEFVPVITLRRDAYDQLKAQLQPIPGAVFREDQIPLAPSRTFARALLGTTGPATEEIAKASEGRVAVGDETGLSGLQAAQDEVLAGSPGVSVRVVPAPGAGGEPRELKAFAATPGRSITITLDARIQLAADEVMADAPKPAALVAIRPSTGDVLAVANGPASAAGYNRAMIGRYPPGSTFKVATTFALLGKGLTPDTPIDCPASVIVGKRFSNAGGEVLGTVPFRTDFAESCNTAFVGQSKTITAQDLTDAAGILGYRDIDLGVPLFGGSVPVTDNPTEHAANMIGQGKVEASPFSVALASASVAAGRSVQPRLIVDPAHPDPTLGAELPADRVAALRELMRGVVTNGTGTALLGVPGGDVAGKTGTAEFGTDTPPHTHAWFTGFQGDLAFAVLVEDGGFGGEVAAPLAAAFLSKLAAG